MAAKRKQPADPGLQLIDTYTEAIVQSHMDRVRGAGYTADAIERELVAVKALAARYREGLRADYLARTQR